MAPKLNPEYSEMLSTPILPADGHSKNAIESLQKQINFHLGEVNRLRYTQNTHTNVSRLPAELLAEAFLCVVESGLRDSDTCFATGTFTFLQVCKRWNEVAVGFPRLWRYWVPGAVRAWPMFNSRSKGTPVFLTWRPRLPDSARDVLMYPTIPKRIHRLDFIGTSEQLAHLLGVFYSSPPSNLSSIRLQILPYDDREPREHLVRFLSSSFPKLSQIQLENFLPSSSSPIFATPNLTSLKLFLPFQRGKRYTYSQFSQIFQRHPNLQELDLNCGAIPRSGPSGASVPFILPQLVNLRLYGEDAAISGFIDLIGMSSPLHEASICFAEYTSSTIPTLASTMEKILAAYYECQGLNCPRKIYCLAISYNSEKRYLAFNTRSRRSTMPNFKFNLRIQFNGISTMSGDMVKATFPLFPWNDVREFAVDGLVVHGNGYCEVFQKMKNVLEVRLRGMAIGPVLDGLSLSNRDKPDQQTAPKLESLTLARLNIFEYGEQLLDVLGERREHNAGLKKLVVRSCLARGFEYQSKVAEFVEEVKWDNAKPMGGGYDLAGIDSSPDTDEPEDNLDDNELGKYHLWHGLG